MTNAKRSRSYVPRHSATCTRCNRRPVTPPSEVNSVRLCDSCADEVYPGADPLAYAEVLRTYGYARPSLSWTLITS